MPRKVFTAGEVLAAADVNEFLMDQAVQTFASSAARGSAITTPVEGMVTYLEDTNELQVYSGAAFVNVAGLELINNTNISSSTVNLSNILTSKYNRYRVSIEVFASTTSPLNTLLMRFRENVTDKATEYYGGRDQVRFDAARNANGFNNSTSITLSTGIGVSGNRSVASFDLYRSATDGVIVGNGYDGAQSGGFYIGANNSNMTNFTGLSFFSSGGATLTGNVKVYGYKEAI
jgi:hypothetical protein